MSEFTVQLERIQIAPDEKRGEDGAVYYLILSPCEECKTNPRHHCCAAHPGMVHHYERQGFRRGEFGHRLDATDGEKRTDCANLWGWDGNTTSPSLTPSFLAAHGRPYVMHSYLRAGQLELCGDSTVRMHPSPISCFDEDERE